MAEQKETFFTTVGCMDGRVQEPVSKFGHEKFHARYPDTITEAGLVGLLAQSTSDEFLLSSLKKKLLISLEKHHSTGIIVHGHQECAGNPVDDALHKDHIRTAVAVIASLINHQVPVMGVFVLRTAFGWSAEELS